MNDWKERAEKVDPAVLALSREVVRRVHLWRLRAAAKVPDWGWYARTGEYRSRRQGLIPHWIPLSILRSEPCKKSLSSESGP